MKRRGGRGEISKLPYRFSLRANCKGGVKSTAGQASSGTGCNGRSTITIARAHAAANTSAW